MYMVCSALSAVCIYLIGFLSVTGPDYTGPTYPSWLGRQASLPWVDAIACRHDKRLSLIVVNRSDKLAASVDVNIAPLQLESTTCNTYKLGGHPDSTNTFDNRAVSVKQSQGKFTGKCEIEPSTLVVYALAL